MIASVTKSFMSKYSISSFTFFPSNYSRYIIEICFPVAADSQHVLLAAIVANSFLSTETAGRYYFVDVTVIKSFL